MTDLLLDQNHDIAITPSLDITTTISLSQAIKIRLLWFLGEWEYNCALGVAWFDEVFGKERDIQRIKQFVSETILSIPGISTVDNISVITQNSTRTAIISFKSTAYNGETITESFEI